MRVAFSQEKQTQLVCHSSVAQLLRQIARRLTPSGCSRVRYKKNSKRRRISGSYLPALCNQEKREHQIRGDHRFVRIHVYLPPSAVLLYLLYKYLIAKH